MLPLLEKARGLPLTETEALPRSVLMRNAKEPEPMRPLTVGIRASSSRKSLRMPQAPAQFRAMASLDRNRGARLWMWEGTEIRQALAAGGSKS